jgi:hypothetical protein
VLRARSAGERRLPAGAVEQAVDGVTGHPVMLLRWAVRGGGAGQPLQLLDDVGVGALILETRVGDHQVDRGQRQGRQVRKCPRAVRRQGGSIRAKAITLSR